jgi:hypothetical protein
MAIEIAHWVYIIASPLLSVFCIVINLTACYVFSKTCKLGSFSFLMILTICICDIAVCVYSNTLYVISLADISYVWTLGPVACKTFRSITMFFNAVQIFSLSILSIARYRRLVHSDKAPWTTASAVVALSLICVAALALTMPRLFIFDEVVVTTTLNGSMRSNETLIWSLRNNDTLNGSMRNNDSLNLSMRNNETMNGSMRSNENWDELELVGMNCKPVGLSYEAYAASTLAIFVLCYVLPGVVIIYTSISAQHFMLRKRHESTIAWPATSIGRYNQRVSMTFNLTTAMFLVIWTPFFLLAVLDLRTKLFYNSALRNMNFSLRCTLLLLGNAKPLIYYVCLDKFRRGVKMLIQKLRCVSVSSVYPSTRSVTRNTATH